MVPQGVTASFHMALPNENATRSLAMQIAAALKPGDVVTLSGDLGAGKTTFARALIRILAQDLEMEVPSPTFTLMQIYELPRFAVVHVDLFRVIDVDYGEFQPRSRRLGLPRVLVEVGLGFRERLQVVQTLLAELLQRDRNDLPALLFQVHLSFLDRHEAGLDMELAGPIGPLAAIGGGCQQPGHQSANRADALHVSGL